MLANIILKLDQFVRSFEINKDQSFSLLLGAGASISSDIPSAYDCIWNWKQRIYISQTGEDLGNADFKSENVKLFIQQWLDNEGYIHLWVTQMKLIGQLLILYTSIVGWINA